MRRYLHFVTQPYSLSVIRPLAQLIAGEKLGEQLIFIAPKLKRQYDLPFPVCQNLREALAFQPEVVFVPGNVVYPALPGLKVQIFHGLCEEKRGHYKITGFFDLYCTSGPLITARFQQLAKKHGFFHVIETGWPKVDAILEPCAREQLCARLGVPLENRVVLYAPTFSPRFKSTQKMITIIEQLPRENETWFVKLHDLMAPAEKDYFSKIAGDRIRFYNYHDNIPLLQLADVLISDTSSIVYEFVLLDKPVITLDARVRLQKGINLSDISQLRAAIDRSLADPGEYHEGRVETINAIHPYHDRQSARRVIAAVEHFLQNDLAAQLRPKPLNLFRKLQVRRQMKVWL